MKVDVLGTTYEIIADRTDFLQSNNADGVCKNYAKTIIVRELDHYLDSDATPDEKESRRQETLRHELVHAFFGEAGLTGYSHDEVLVDWLAIQFPKIYKAFITAGAIETTGGDTDG